EGTGNNGNRCRLAHFWAGAGFTPKRLTTISYCRYSRSFHETEGLPCTIRGKTPAPIGQQDLRFVRRSVSYCSAVAGGFLALPSPSLGVSSLDLGRSRKVSGPFLLGFGFSRPGQSAIFSPAPRWGRSSSSGIPARRSESSSNSPANR